MEIKFVVYGQSHVVWTIVLRKHPSQNTTNVIGDVGIDKDDDDGGIINMRASLNIFLKFRLW